MVLDVAIEWRGNQIAPFAKAPWRHLPLEHPRFPPGMPPHLARLSADFFCAPFCADDVEGSPAHGKTANSRWRLVDVSRSAPHSRAVFELCATVAGASVTKTLLLIDHQPFLYQQHVLTGADVRLPVAHHTMVDATGGIELRVSPVLFAETPASPLESDPAMGRSVLAYPARSADPASFPRADGARTSLLSFPFSERQEDFAVLIDDQHGSDALGWAIAFRRGHGDSVVLAKATRQLPETMLWFSNGGRTYAPWLGEHTEVLGIEMGCSYSSNGWAASIAANPFSEAGIPTSVDVREGERTVVSYAMGAAPGLVRYVDGGFVTQSPETATAPVPFTRDLVTGDSLFQEMW